MEGGCWLVGGWVEERATLCLRRRDSFLLPSLSPFRRKTFGCLPRDNFLRYVINVYGQPAKAFNRAASAFYDSRGKKKKGGDAAGGTLLRQRKARNRNCTEGKRRPRCDFLISDSILFPLRGEIIIGDVILI